MKSHVGSRPTVEGQETLGSRDLVVVSGYYGFDNLGDEAILEEILAEVGRLVEDKSKIVVLSQNPEKTRAVFGVSSVDRWKLSGLLPIFDKTKLFISGGGGLYQDSSSVKSVVYYFGLAMIALLKRAPSIIYAQGVGPLRSALSVALTKSAMKSARAITVRDSDSVALLKSWGIDNARLTADPVWCLEPSPLPPEVLAAFENLPPERFLVGLSIRESHHVTRETVEAFAREMAQTVPPHAILVPLVLQRTQDTELLEAFSAVWKSKGLKTLDLDFSRIVRPSQWLSLLGMLDLVVGMRFHALLMALKSGVPSVGLAYDPKVSYLMKNFEQPCLILAKGKSDDELASELANHVKTALNSISELSAKADNVTASQKALACQNFDVIAKILNS